MKKCAIQVSPLHISDIAFDMCVGEVWALCNRHVWVNEFEAEWNFAKKIYCFIVK